MELDLVAEASETATQDLAENDFVNLMFLKLYYTVHKNATFFLHRKALQNPNPPQLNP